MFQVHIWHIQDNKSNDQDFVELGVQCGDVSSALARALEGRRPEDFSVPARNGMERFVGWVQPAIYTARAPSTLCSTMVDIQRKITEKGERGFVSKFFGGKDDKMIINAWKSDLIIALEVFNVRSTSLVPCDRR
jgi:hypothetical protein